LQRWSLDLKKQKIYKKVFEIARGTLLNSNCEAQFINAGVAYEKIQDQYSVDILYFDEMITLKIPEFLFKSSKGANVTLVTKIIILHYINSAVGSLPGVDKISYGDIPGLAGYLPVFEQRVARPLITAFGFDKHVFLETGVTMGGIKEDYGDASFTLHALPRIPITFILWEGDEEFQPSLKILFDPSIIGYLPLEDITIISKLASTRIIKEARFKRSRESIY
jgi:hypothetical protein